MPPHCDSLDGPVVTVARAALDGCDPAKVLAYVPEEGEEEVRTAFDAVVAIRDKGPDVRAVADRYFFETVVRVHRAGEGAPYTGLKPAGLDVGPVIPVAERAIRTGSADELVSLLTDSVASEVRARLSHVMELKGDRGESLIADREYVTATLGLQVWAHKLHAATTARAHEHHHSAG